MLSKFNNESRFNLLSFPINNFRAASSVSLDSEKSAVVSFTINISFESASIEAQGRLTPEPGGGSWRGFSWLHRNKIDRTRRPGINLVDSACLRSRENLQMHGTFSFFFFLFVSLCSNHNEKGASGADNSRARSATPRMEQPAVWACMSVVLSSRGRQMLTLQPHAPIQWVQNARRK